MYSCKMSPFFIYISFFYPLMVNSLSIEDLQALFNNRDCIEGSLASFSLNQNEEVMLDSNNVQQEPTSLSNINWKNSVLSKVNELAQYNKIESIYTLVDESGPPHEKTYIIRLSLGDETYEGSGFSLRKAKQSAAASALETTFYERPPEKIQNEEEKSQTPTVVLNNIAMKLGISVSYYLLNGKEEQTIKSYGAVDEPYGKAKSLYPKINSSTVFLQIPNEEPQISGPFTVKVNVGNLSFKGIGHTVQGARHHAASIALQYMEKKSLFKDNVCSNEDSVAECKQKKENLKSPISRINEAAQKHNLPFDCNLIGESGKPHKKIFVTQCKLGDFITEGEGASKKESKKSATEKLLRYLPKLPQVYPTNFVVNGLSNKTKKKKKKIKQESVSGLIDGISQVTASLWGTTIDSSSPNNQKSFKSQKTASETHFKSPKDEILVLGNQLNIPIDFEDLNMPGDNFLSLMSLGVKPPHICLGKGVTRLKSHETAAMFGLKFLQKSGIFEKPGFTQYKEDLFSFESYEFKEEVHPRKDTNMEIANNKK